VWRFVLVLIAAVIILAPSPASPSPGGSRTTEPQLAFTRAGGIWTIGADGTRARALLRDAYAPSWSPDGTRLAFFSRRPGDEEVYLARADGTGVRRLTKLPGPDLSPAWSSDGRRLAWSRSGEIWTMSANGTMKQRLVRKAAIWHEHHTPTWHGAELVYSSTRVSTFNTELFRAPAKRLTFTKGSDGVLGDDSMPDFSADGRRIVFTSNRDQQGEIYVMNADGSGQKRLTRRAGDDWAPRFSPDGQRISFTQLPGTIWTMNADGTGLKKLTAGTDADWRP
jgi:Tol biopolymer transport system component